ncbi:unnamed protein product [Rhizoctonia solani]|uniref:NACHT domain-containing protein n=1 Tax=Rhizoctonia solani TaxID=456999 RepID=A0A8H3CJA4_9AGAM|nr:unnamed protein product [Rhizoctonia solani]
MSSPPGTPKPIKRLQFFKEPFDRSRSWSQSKSPSHNSQPLPQLDPRASPSVTGSNEGTGLITNPNAGVSPIDTTETNTHVVGSLYAGPSERASTVPGIPMIMEPIDGGSGATQPVSGQLEEVISRGGTTTDDISLNPTPAEARSTASSMPMTAEHTETAPDLRLLSLKPEHLSPIGNASRPATPVSTVALARNQKNRNIAWNGLWGSLQILRNMSRIFPPLGSAIESLLLCLDGLEIAVQNRQDYEDLATELTTLSESLKQHVNGSSSVLLSDSATSVAMAIEREVMKIQDRLGRVLGPGLREASTEEEALVRHYQQIQGHFRLLQANASMSTRNIVDEQLVNTRLEGLNPAKGAAYDSGLSTVISRRSCTEGTRTEVLAGLDCWLGDPSSSSAYWMNGMAGTGKTTIASTFCEQVEKRKLLAASFFCTRSSAECRTVTRIVPTIAYQLARYSIPYQSALCKILGQSPDMGSNNISRQFEQLLKEPLQQVKDAMPEHLVVVIDALDECDDRDGVELILDMLFRHASQVPLKFLITSRPEPEIYDKMIHSKSREVIHLHEIEKSLVQADIELYLNEELAFMPPSPAEIEQLVERSGTLFIYAATLVRYIRSRKADPQKRLQSILSVTPQATKKNTQIDALYMAVLKSALSDYEMEAGETKDIWAVLRTVLSAQEPISIETVATLAGTYDPKRVEYVLHSLRSVLHQSEGTGLVSTLHASFPDFMFSNERAGSYYCDIIEHSRLLAQRCFLVMKEQLRFNICDLATSFVPNEKVEDLKARTKKNISPTLAYACRYWASHLAPAPRLDILQTMLDEFLSYQLLFWVEVLSLHQELIMGVESLLKAKHWLTHTRYTLSDLVLSVEDARNFVTGYAASPASRSTPHIYISSLPLCPQSSWVYKHYSKRMEGLLELKGNLVQNRETAALAIWDVGSSINSVAYSPDGSRVVVGNTAHEVTVRSAYDGTVLIGPLRDHAANVESVTFSPDGKYLASSSGPYDLTIRVWDTIKGAPVADAFEGHTRIVRSISFSTDGARIVSGSFDRTIRVWNTYDGKLLVGPLEGHTASIYSVAFSPNGDLVASGSEDKTIKLWDAYDGTSIAPTFIGHTEMVASIAFVPDGTRLVSGSSDRTIRIWSVLDGSCVASLFNEHSSPINSLAVSPDGTKVAFGGSDRTVRVWKIDDGTPISGPFVGHTSWVNSVAYSPDGTQIISGSVDKTIRVWNVRDNKFSPTSFPPPKTTLGIQSVVFSTGVTHFTSSDADGVVRVWDVSDGSFTTCPVKARFFPSPLSDLSPDNSYIASFSEDGEVRILNTTNGSVVAGPFGFDRKVLSTARFSHNSKAFIMGCEDGTIKVCTLSDQQQAPVGSFRGHSGMIKSFSESADCSLIVSYSDRDNAFRVWSLLTPALELPCCVNPSLTTASGPDYSVLYEGWHITNDGWVTNAAGHLLFWVPGNIAFAWWSPYATLVITESGTLQVPKQKPLIGDQWTRCYLPE